MKKINNSLCPIIKELERIYDNLAIQFNLTTPRPLITIQTKGRKKDILGWYGAEKWKSGKKQINEINICAENLNKNPVETLIHEMVHYHNYCEKIEDCNVHQYHNRHFKIRAENYGLNVEKSGRNGWSYTSISSNLQKIIDKIKVNKQVFNLYRQVVISLPTSTKMKKFRCDCTTIRCATNLLATCLKCNKQFQKE